MTRAPSFVAVACLAILPLVACGGDDSGDGHGTADTVTATDAPADTPAPATEPPTTEPVVTDAPADTAAPDDTSTADTTTDDTVEATDAAVFAITTEVVGGQPAGGVRSYLVEVGQTVEITVTSDVAEEAHLHGYDLDADLQPGVPATFTFTADMAGSFEMELHGSGALLFYLDVV